MLSFFFFFDRIEGNNAPSLLSLQFTGDAGQHYWQQLLLLLTLPRSTRQQQRALCTVCPDLPLSPPRASGLALWALPSPEEKEFISDCGLSWGVGLDDTGS